MHAWWWWWWWWCTICHPRGKSPTMSTRFTVIHRWYY
jgi:hypothetical protein